MAGFASIEPEALDQIRFRIKGLPNPEELNALNGDPVSLKRLAKEVGEIMHLLEIYGKKGPEFKARFESLKGLPPRYKVLEWRKANMKNTDFVRQVVKLSAIVDSKGHGEISDKLNSFAKNVLDNKGTKEEAETVVLMLTKAGMENESKIIRESAWWNPKGFGKQVMDTAKGIGQQMGENIKTKWQGGGRYKDNLTNEINNALEKFRQSMDTNVLFGETKKLINGWGKVNLSSKLPPEEAKVVQGLLDYVKKLEGKAQQFNTRMLTEFNTWIDTEKQAIASIGGTAPAAPEAPEAPEASTDPAASGGEADVDTTTLDGATIDSILAALGESVTASQRKNIRTIRLGAALPPNILAYIEKLKSDPAAKAKFIEQLKARKAEIAKGTTAPGAAIVDQNKINQKIEEIKSSTGAAPAGAAPGGWPVTQVNSALEKWYEANKNNPTVLQEALKYYQSNPKEAADYAKFLASKGVFTMGSNKKNIILASVAGERAPAPSAPAPSAPAPVTSKNSTNMIKISEMKLKRIIS